MKWTNWMISGGLTLALAAGCAQADEPADDADVTTTPDELGTHFSASGRADGADVRKLSDGRVVFYGDSARELVTLGNVSPRTVAEQRGDVTYAQSPFAYCAFNDVDAACVSYLPRATVVDDVLTFGGQRSSRTVEARKASDLVLAMYHGGYDETSAPPMLSLSRPGSPLSCTYGAGAAECTVSLNATGTRLELSFDALPELGDDFVYEGWLVVDGSPLPAGRFAATDHVVFEFDEDLSAATAYALTIEPAVGDDPGPSGVRLLLGALTNGHASLTVDLGNDVTAADLTAATGTYILAAPSAEDDTGAFDDKGIWFLDPSGPTASLNLPPLPDSWAYEGWIVTDNGPISTGRFMNPAGPDSDAGGPAAGPGMTPPFPGQDFVNPPLSLPGSVVVISVEPEPDNSPMPFALKPLIGMIADAGVGVSQMLDANGEALPMGEVTLR